MFADVVSLYRESGRPDIVAGAFSYAGTQTGPLLGLIKICSELPRHEGYFELDPEEEGDQVSFNWKLAVNEHGRFYSNVDDFALNCEALAKGVVPQYYYLQEEDFSSQERGGSSRLLKLLELVRLIRGLSKLSFAASTDYGRQKLLFVLPAGKDTAPRTLEVDTTLSLRCLAADAVDAELLCDLTSDDAEKTLHVNEHRQLFRTAIATVLARRTNGSQRASFEYLVENWKEVISVYQLNADCYVQNFSFEKMKAEIAKVELDYATRVSAILGESSSKLLALPLSVAGLAGVVGSDSVPEAGLLVLGMLVVALILSGVIKNQLFAAERVQAGFLLAISDLDGGTAKYPESLMSSIGAATKAFGKQLRFLRTVYAVVRPLAWLPAILGVAIMAVRFQLDPLIAFSIVWVCACLVWIVAMRWPKLLAS